MINFYVIFDPSEIYQGILVYDEKNQKIPENNLLKVLVHNSPYKYYENEYFEILSLGDIFHGSEKKVEDFFSEFTIFSASQLLHTLKGTFYLLIFDKRQGSLNILNSLFSILPLYYYQNDKILIISSCMKNILSFSDQSFRINKSFILERLLFNYAFLNSTIYKNIYIVPSNHYVHLMDKKSQFIRHTEIERYFASNPKPWEKSLEYISNFFLGKTTKYFDRDKIFLTLTGGFDSRTLVAYALSEGLKFKTFSYGLKTDNDIQVPMDLANKIGFEHLPFILDYKYAEEYYLENVCDLIRITEGNASFTRSHYAYIAKQLAKQTNIIYSGNFGSEIIRTMRIPGVMTSGFLFYLFSEINKEQLYHGLCNHTSLKFINMNNYSTEIDQLLEEIWKYRAALNPDLSESQKFYIYMFEEVFRKYFGPEYVIQQSYNLLNRSPFLDFEFLLELLQTELAGANGAFMEKNPLIRFRGQILYAYIMKKLNSPLSEFPIDRGYRPADFFNKAGKLNIAKHYLYNYHKKAQKATKAGYNELCFKSHLDWFKGFDIDEELFNSNNINRSFGDLTIPRSHVLSLIINQNLNL